MILIDTKEKSKWLMDKIENDELLVVSRTLTEKDSAEISAAIAEHKAARRATRAPAPRMAYA